jgi:hypothetical protein
MSRLSRQCGILKISQPCRPLRPVAGIAFYLRTLVHVLGVLPNLSRTGTALPLPMLDSILMQPKKLLTERPCYLARDAVKSGRI